ncbi:26295_t:CDS:2, partial [Gigaspora margarita]
NSGYLWTQMAKSNAKKEDLEILKAQLCQYACNEKLYNRSYVPIIDSPIQLWKTTRDSNKTKPGDQHTNLGIKNLELMIKISSYLISNAKQELYYYRLNLIEKEIQTVFQDITLFSE